MLGFFKGYSMYIIGFLALAFVTYFLYSQYIMRQQAADLVANEITIGSLIKTIESNKNDIEMIKKINEKNRALDDVLYKSEENVREYIRNMSKDNTNINMLHNHIYRCIEISTGSPITKNEVVNPICPEFFKK